MKYSKAIWIHELALQHCLIDPRIDIDLRKEIAFFVLSFAQKKHGNNITSIAKLTEKDLIIIYKNEFPNQNQTLSYVVNRELESQNKLTIQKEIKSSRVDLEVKIKKMIENAIKSNSDIEKDQIPKELYEVVNNYCLNLKSSFEMRVMQIAESFMQETINQNKINLKSYQDFKKNLQTFHTSFEVFKPQCERIPLTNGQFAYISSFIGRSKELSLPYVHRQEDRAGIIANIQLHKSWENRIPELLIYVTQRLAVEMYKNIPIIDWCNHAESKEFNFSNNGSTLTLLFTYFGKAYALTLGDSPAICLKKDLATGKVISNFITSPHHVGEEFASSELEVERVTKAGGQFSEKGNRVKNPFGDLALSRSLGDLEAIGVSDIGSITIKKLDPNTVLFCGSDGVFDFLSIQQMESLFKHIKTEDLAVGFCAEAFKNQRNHDNITGVLIPSENNVFGFVADGHGGSTCIVDYVYKNLCSVFKTLAENVSPDETSRLDERNSKKRKIDSKHSLEIEMTNSFFKTKTDKEICFSKPYDREAILKKINSSPSFRNDNLKSKILDQQLLEENEVSFFIREKDKDYYKIHYVREEVVKHSIFYLPTDYPMSYQEYSQITYKENIISSEDHFDQYLSKLLESGQDDMDSESTQSPEYV